MYKVEIETLIKINKTLIKFSKKSELTNKDRLELKKLSDFIKDNYLYIKQ